VGWGDTTEKKNSFFMMKDAVWYDASKEDTGIPHVTLACHL
jgi:hypothetical protein